MNPQGRQAEPAGHERRDADVLNLFLLAALLLIMIGVCLLVCLATLRQLDQGRLSAGGIQPKKTRPAKDFPPPHLIVKPGRELATTNQTAETSLTSYGWVDRKAGRVRIPIARAMELLLERGLPEVGEGQTRLQLMQSRPGGSVQPTPMAASPSPETQP